MDIEGWQPANREQTGRFDYHVCVHCFESIEDYLVYPIRLEHRLPKVAIPLLPEDGVVPLDLQAVFDRCYDAGPYRRRIHSLEQPPEPPLTPAQTEWTKAVVSRSKSEP